MKCTRVRMKLLSPKFRLRFGTWNVRTMYGKMYLDSVGDEEVQLEYSWSKRGEVEYFWVPADCT